MEDQKLRSAVTSAQSGNADGFKTILELYATRLYSYFYRSTQNHHDSEDLLSRLALKLVKKISKYDERGKFEPWLFSIAANLIRDRIRRKKVRPVFLNFSQSKDAEYLTEDTYASPDTSSPDDGLIKAEQEFAVQQALGSLDEVTRELILLRFFGQLSFKELAVRFKMPVGTVLARVHRGLKTLKGKLDKKEE